MLSMMMITAITAVALPQLRITTLSVVRSMAMAYALAAVVVALSNLNGVLTLFNGSVVYDTMGTYLAGCFFILATAIMAHYSAPVLDKAASPYTLVILQLIMGVGAIYLMTGSDLVTIAVALELQSFALYALAAIHRWEEGSTSAGLMYFMLGAFASGLVLLGISMIYAFAGETSIEGLMAHCSYASGASFIKASLIVMTAGLLFKVGAGGVHYWAPEVYDRVSTTMTIVLNVLPKIALFGLFARISPLLGAAGLMPYLGVMTTLSWGFGSIVGLVQLRIKRLLAYSTISHVGWMLGAITAGTSLGGGAFMFYLLQYSATTVASFLVLLAIGTSAVLYGGVAQQSRLSDVQWISSLDKLYARAMILSVVMIATLLSAAGIPPFIGFYAKLAVLQSLLYGSSPLLVLVGVGSSIVSAGYYLSIIATMTFGSTARLLPGQDYPL